MKNFEFVIENLEVRTKGLVLHGYPELRVQVTERSLISDAEGFLKYVANYMKKKNVAIRPGETFAYGYWLTKFISMDEGTLDVWEYNSQATEFIPGVLLTLTYWRDQHEVCKRFGAKFLPPRPDKLVVISDGVMEGDPVQGIRYPSPEHMSGWWITTDRYNGDVNSLRKEHLYHFTASRKDLASYIALPYGYRFDLGITKDVWFDEEVAKESCNK